MAYSHCTRAGPELMGSDLFFRNVHIGPRQGKESGPIVFYRADHVPCTCPSPLPVQCE